VRWVECDLTSRPIGQDGGDRESVPTDVLLATLPVGVLTYGADGRCRSANQAATVLTGVPHDVLLSQDFREIPSWRPSQLNLRADEVLAGGPPFEGEVDMTTTAGREVCLRFRLRLVPVDGEVFLLAVFDDVTERKTAEASLRLMHFCVDQASDLIQWVGPDGRLLYVSDSYCRRHGYSREELLEMAVFDLSPTMNPKRWAEHWALLQAQGSLRIETIHRTKGGEEFPVEITATYIEHEGRQLNFSFGRDISERKELEHSLHLTQYSMDGCPDYIFWTGPQGQFLNVGTSACRRLGYTRDELLALTIYDLDPIAPRPWSKHWKELKEAGSLTFETEHKTKAGEVFPVEVTASYVEYDGREYDFGFTRDITERRRVQEELRAAKEATEDANRELVRLVRTDFLTGALNRRAVLERLGEEVLRAERQGSSLGVGMIDIDHFKRVNDAYGHGAGDQVLCEVVARAQAAVRRYDVFGRFGGEEFLVIVPNAPYPQIRTVLERVRAAVGSSPFLVDGQPLDLTLSIGGTASQGEPVDSLIRAADNALYRAKAAGRDRVVIFDHT
jgi:diguanylate cyclase (GGDEF)-like protein/PAS domain S-box-containing protein